MIFNFAGAVFILLELIFVDYFTKSTKIKAHKIHA